ncbi:MAG: DUF664 domain-containing protein [Anaerolineae bacterium]|nr:DUF664 domain-containing protein [Anaerolineae bacterium]
MGSQPFGAALWTTLETLHREIGNALQGLPADALNWQPAEGANSLYVLATHVAGAERYWLGEVVGGQSQRRDRDAEFRARGNSAEAPLQVLSDAGELSRQVLMDLRPEAWTETRMARGHEYTLGWCVLHAIEHAALHLGHMQLTRQLWEAQNAL